MSDHDSYSDSAESADPYWASRPWPSTLYKSAIDEYLRFLDGNDSFLPVSPCKLEPFEALLQLFSME